MLPPYPKRIGAVLVAVLFLSGLSLLATARDEDRPLTAEKEKPATTAGKKTAKVEKSVPAAPLTSERINQVKGLELTAPQRRTRPGLAYVSAIMAVKADSKVRIVWDVESQWEDEDVSVEWETRDQGRKIQITIPDSSGLIKITAVAIVDGEPTDTRMAKTLIEVRYTPRKRQQVKDQGQPTPDKPAPAAAAQKTTSTGKVTDAYFVIDSESGDDNVNALVASQGLRNDFRKADVKPHVLDVNSPAVARAGLTPFVKDGGGAPVMILVTEARKVRKVVKLTRETTLANLTAQLK